jgi:hypothetical protein
MINVERAYYLKTWISYQRHVEFFMEISFEDMDILLEIWKFCVGVFFGDIEINNIMKKNIRRLSWRDYLFFH